MGYKIILLNSVFFIMLFIGTMKNSMGNVFGYQPELSALNSNYPQFNSQNNDCVMCSLYGSGQYPLPYRYNNYSNPISSYSPSMNMAATPWWGIYGSMSYPNYQFPAAWSNYGVNGSMYAGHGGGFAGKPNLYITAPAGSEFIIKVNFSEESNLLFTVPAYANGWNVKINNDKISVNQVEYDYLFYDIRFDENLFSDDSGFCGNKDLIMSEMLSTLKKLSFKDQEVNDFYEYWTIKLPPSKSYCVFPQFTQDTERAYSLKIVQKKSLPIKMTRVTFMVATDEALKDNLNKKFRHPPIDRLSYLAKIKNESNRKSSVIELREWAVAFMESKL